MNSSSIVCLALAALVGDLLLVPEPTKAEDLLPWIKSYSSLSEHLVEKVPSEHFEANLAELRRLAESKMTIFKPDIRRGARALVHLADFEQCDLEVAKLLNLARISLDHVHIYHTRVRAIFRELKTSTLRRCEPAVDSLYEAALAKVGPEDLDKVRQSIDHHFIEEFYHANDASVGKVLDQLVRNILERAPGYRKAQLGNIQMWGRISEGLFRRTIERDLLKPCANFYRQTEDMWKLQEMSDAEQTVTPQRSGQRADDLRRLYHCAKFVNQKRSFLIKRFATVASQAA